MSVAFWSGSLLAWERELAALKDRVGLCVRRPKLRTSIGHYLYRLLSGVERKTGWLLAERAGDARPHRLQAVLDGGGGMPTRRAISCAATQPMLWPTLTRCS